MQRAMTMVDNHKKGMCRLPDTSPFLYEYKNEI